MGIIRASVWPNNAYCFDNRRLRCSLDAHDIVVANLRDLGKICGIEVTLIKMNHLWRYASSITVFKRNMEAIQEAYPNAWSTAGDLANLKLIHFKVTVDDLFHALIKTKMLRQGADSSACAKATAEAGRVQDAN